MSQNDPLIKAAAKLRAQGVTWEGIAEQIGVSRGTVTHWPSRKGDIWMPAYELAMREVIANAESKALKWQEEMLEVAPPDGEDVDRMRLAQSAAHSLLNHSSKLRAQHIDITAEGGGLSITLIEAKPPEAAKEGQDGEAEEGEQ